MNRCFSTILPCVFLLNVLNARVLVVTRSQAGEMAVIEAEEFKLNGSEKVRTLVAGVPRRQP